MSSLDKMLEWLPHTSRVTVLLWLLMMVAHIGAELIWIKCMFARLS